LRTGNSSARLIRSSLSVEQGPGGVIHPAEM
jgi:hypothetical protein